MRFDFSFEPASDRQSDTVDLRIAILADFGGKGTADQAYAVDFDNFDEVFTGVGVALTLPPREADASEIELRFGTLEDFHPDQLLSRVQPLASLVQLRSRLLNPGTADTAAEELQRRLHLGSLSPKPPPQKRAESTDETLARLLGKPAPQPGDPASATGLAQRMIQQIFGSDLQSAHPPPSHLVELAETEIAAALNAILHQPAFQALEATWRGLDFLVRNVTEEVKLYFIDIDKNQLETMVSVDDLGKSPIQKQLEKISPTVILGGYTFGPRDSFVLRQLARLAALANTVFVAAGSPEFMGCKSFGRQPDPDNWTETSSDELQEFESLRRKPEAARLGLVMPRFLLRQPYGKASDSIETFGFEEMPAQPDHEFYLWGNSAFIYGLLLAQAVAGEVLATETSDGEIGGLPIHKFTSDGSSAVKPCAEVWLSERTAERILEHGIMPLLSIQGRDAVRLWEVRPISNPPEPLPVHLQFEE